MFAVPDWVTRLSSTLCIFNKFFGRDFIVPTLYFIISFKKISHAATSQWLVAGELAGLQQACSTTGTNKITSVGLHIHVLGVYKFVSPENAITALKDNHIPLFQLVINNIELTLGTIIQINKFTLQQEADSKDRDVI